MTDKAMTEHEGLLTWRALALQERERADEAERALDAVAAVLGMAEAEAEGTISLEELRQRIEVLQRCATCFHFGWQGMDDGCAAGVVLSRDGYLDSCRPGDACHFSPSRWRSRWGVSTRGDTSAASRPQDVDKR
jgi:hypothetical protein